MILCLFVFGLSWQLSWCHQSHLEAYHPSPHSKVLPLKEPTYSHLIPISASRSPVEYNVMDEADVHTKSEGHYNRLKSANHIASTELVKFVHPYSTGSTHYEKNIATATPRIFITTKLNNSFTPSVNGITILPAETIPKPNFLIVPQVETIQKPEFFVHENVLGVIQKPEFLIQDIPQILSKPEYLVQEDIVGSIVKPTFLIEEQVNVVEKPEFAIQDDVEIIVKPEFPVQDITEIIPKPTYLVEENVISIEKPSFSIQSTQEIVQKPDIVISPVPVTIQRPEYQIEEDIIPIPKPAFFVQEILETVIKPEFLVTEEVVPVPRPNFLVEEQFQVIQRPNFEIQDVLQTVLKPEYSIQKSTIVVQKPEFIIEEVTETVARPTFVEQEVAETIVSPRFIVEEQVVPVPRPQFVVEETVVPIVKPEFFIENVSEVVTKPEYVIEDMPVVVEKPTFILEETPVIVQKPNFVIEETVETINKPEFLIQEQVEVIQKPEFVIQESVVATIVKPKFIVISASKPMGEEFDPKNYEKISEHASIDFNSYQNPVFDIHTDKHHAINNGESTKKTCSSQNPDYNSKERVEVYDKVPKTTLTVPESQYLTTTMTQKFHLTESTTPNYRTSSQLPPRPLVIAPSLKPQIIAGIEEYSHSTLVDHTTLPFAGVHQTLNQPADFSISTINADYPNIENSKYSRPNDAHPVNVSPKYSLISSSDPEEELFDPKKYEYLVESSSGGLFDRRELPIMIQMHPLKVFPPIPSIPYQVVHIPSLTTPTRTQSKFEPVIPSYSQNIEANFSPFHKADQVKSVPVSQTETVHKIDELYTHDTSNIYNRPLHHTLLQKSSRRPTRIETITPDEKNNINGLEVIGKKLGYQVTVEPNDFKAPKIKIKKSTEKSEGDEMFETLYGHHDLVKNGQYHLEADISHPKYGYLFQDQKSKPIVRQDLIENNMDFSNDTAYDYNENYDVDSLDDYYFVD